MSSYTDSSSRTSTEASSDRKRAAKKRLSQAAKPLKVKKVARPPKRPPALSNRRSKPVKASKPANPPSEQPDPNTRRDRSTLLVPVQQIVFQPVLLYAYNTSLRYEPVELPRHYPQPERDPQPGDPVRLRQHSQQPEPEPEPEPQPRPPPDPYAPRVRDFACQPVIPQAQVFAPFLQLQPIPIGGAIAPPNSNQPVQYVPVLAPFVLPVPPPGGGETAPLGRQAEPPAESPAHTDRDRRADSPHVELPEVERRRRSSGSGGRQASPHRAGEEEQPHSVGTEAATGNQRRLRSAGNRGARDGRAGTQ